jgi:Type IV secretion system pilin
MKKYLVLFLALAVPFAAFAADIADFPGLVSTLTTWLNSLVPLIFGVAMIVFLWGVVRYVIASDVKSKADGRTFIIYGVIGLGVMLSVWGLAFFVKNTFFASAPTTVPEPSSSGGVPNGGCTPGTPC